ncbi:MAG TPA: SIS domain-containing protein [Solirubrobacteraceae bacterium]
MIAEPGVLFLTEVREQPDVLTRLAAREPELETAATALRRAAVRMVRIVGHGTSDNAATYGTYALTLIAGITAFRDSISLPVYYGTDLDAGDSCVIALSQSGRTPDVVEYVERARRVGAPTIAITNDPGSPLANAAEAVVALEAGEERAVAATKTYSAELATLALLAAHASGQGRRYHEGLRGTAQLLAEALPGLEVATAEAAEQLVDAGRMLVFGRGPEYATAREVALKLLETAHLTAAPFTATDFGHGPVAVLDPGDPVWAIAADDPSLPTVVEAVGRANAAGGAVIVTGSAADAIGGAWISIPLPQTPVPWLGPLLSIVPGQLFAAALAGARGLDPDRPRGLAKVTVVP